MTQGITRWWRNDSWAPAGLPNAPGPRTPPAANPTAPQLPADPDDWSAFASSPLSPSATGPAGGLRAVDALQTTRNAAVQRRLDAFLLSMTADYHTSDVPAGTHDSQSHGLPNANEDSGGGQRVAVPFGMSVRYSGQGLIIARRQCLVLRAAQRAHLGEAVVNRIQSGRGAPDEIRALTQALIDTIGRPPGFEMSGVYGPRWTAQSVRKMMFDCAVVIDCAGYTQQAYLAAHGLTRQEAHLGPILNEALFSLDVRGFRRVSALQDVRPGDIVSLGPPTAEPVGHRAIAYDQRVATATDMRSLLALGNVAQAFAVGGPVRVLELDSSWGCGGNPEFGGVQRRTLWYNETTANWAWLTESQTVPNTQEFAISSELFGHPLIGFYRPKGN